MSNLEIFQKIATALVAKVQQLGSLPWVKPWGNSKCLTDAPYRSHRGRAYSWLNCLWLSAQGAPEGAFFTFKAAREAGTPVAKGQHGFNVAFGTMVEKDIEKTDGTKETKRFYLYRIYTVFHTSQLQDYKEPEAKPEPEAEAVHTDIDSLVEAYLNNGGPTLRKGYNEAFYRASSDEVCIPSEKQFKTLAEFHSTELHELAHSTGHASRLDRFEPDAYFGSLSYSKEELVAEITACSILQMYGESTENTERNSIAYLQSWSKFMADKPAEFVSAIGRAQKAVELLTK